MNREELARQEYGCSFEALSHFGKQRIIARLNDQLGMDDIDLARALKVAQEENTKLAKENRELWEENEELRLALITQEEDYASSNRRRSRRRQEEASPES